MGPSEICEGEPVTARRKAGRTEVWHLRKGLQGPRVARSPGALALNRHFDGRTAEQGSSNQHDDVQVPAVSPARKVIFQGSTRHGLSQSVPLLDEIHYLSGSRSVQVNLIPTPPPHHQSHAAGLVDYRRQPAQIGTGQQGLSLSALYGVSSQGELVKDLWHRVAQQSVNNLVDGAAKHPGRTLHPLEVGSPLEEVALEPDADLPLQVFLAGLFLVPELLLFFGKIILPAVALHHLARSVQFFHQAQGGFPDRGYPNNAVAVQTALIPPLDQPPLIGRPFISQVEFQVEIPVPALQFFPVHIKGRDEGSEIEVPVGAQISEDLRGQLLPSDRRFTVAELDALPFRLPALPLHGEQLPPLVSFPDLLGRLQTLKGRLHLRKNRRMAHPRVQNRCQVGLGAGQIPNHLQEADGLRHPRFPRMLPEVLYYVSDLQA